MSRSSNLKVDIPLHLKSGPALCKGFPIDTFIPDIHSGMTKKKRDEKEVYPKSICASCPLKITCLNYALEDEATVGIWGGTNELERDTIRKERRHLKLVTENQ